MVTQISNKFNFVLTDDLGSYLGVPCLHNGVTRYTYDNLVEKL